MTTGNDVKGVGEDALAGTDEDFADGDPQDLAIGSLTSQADFDKLMMTGKFVFAPMAALNRRTDWNGLTAKQEQEKEDERQWRKRQDQALAVYEHEMDEIRERAEKLDKELDDWERDLRKRQAEADAHDIVLHDGRRVLVGQTGEFVDKASGQRLSGADNAEAERKKKANSTTVEQDKKLRDEWAALGEAKDHVRKAKSLTAQDGPERSPEEIAEARKQLAEAEEIAKRKRRLEASLDNGSILSDTDTSSALRSGEQQSVRTPSYAATLDPKDSRSASLQDQFTVNAQARNLQSVSVASALSSTDALSALGLDDQQVVQPSSVTATVDDEDSQPAGLKERFSVNAKGTSMEIAAKPSAPAVIPSSADPAAPKSRISQPNQ